MRAFVGIGACYLDHILTVNGFPKEDEKLRAASYMERRGGNVMNTLEVLAQLIQTFNAQKEDPRRLPLYAVTVLPDNSWGNSVMTSMGPNVNMRHCITREAVFNTPSSHIIQNQITGSRTIISHNNLPEMTFEEFIEIYRALPRGGKWFHFEGRNTNVALKCIEFIRKSDHTSIISVEIEKPGREGLLEMALAADLAFFSKSYAKAAGFEDAESFLMHQSTFTQEAAYLCCSWGESGAALIDRKNETVIQSEAFLDHSRPALDTTGAGDTFLAGLIFSTIFMEGKGPGHMLRQLNFANRVAGLKVMRKGFDGLGKDMAGHMWRFND